MKNIPEERLSTIGKLIEVTREEKRNKSQNKYTMKSFVEGICTVNTLKELKLVKSQESKMFMWNC